MAIEMASWLLYDEALTRGKPLEPRWYDEEADDPRRTTVHGSHSATKVQFKHVKSANLTQYTLT